MLMYVQSLQPVQTGGNIFLTLFSETKTPLTLKIFNEKGIIAQKLTREIEDGLHQLQLDLQHLQKGRYIINAFSGDLFIKAFKIVKF
jgi:hypothetical protein